MTTRQIAEQVSVSVSTLRKWAEENVRMKRQSNGNPPTVDPLCISNPSHRLDDGNSPGDMQASQQVEVTARELLSLAELLTAAAPGKTTGRPLALGSFYPDGG